MTKFKTSRHFVYAYSTTPLRGVDLRRESNVHGALRKHNVQEVDDLFVWGCGGKLQRRAVSGEFVRARQESGAGHEEPVLSRAQRDLYSSFGEVKFSYENVAASFLKRYSK